VPAVTDLLRESVLPLRASWHNKDILQDAVLRPSHVADPEGTNSRVSAPDPPAAAENADELDKRCAFHEAVERLPPITRSARKCYRSYRTRRRPYSQ
jgi:hypothetical protein